MPALTLLLACFAASAQALTLTVNTTGGNASSPLLYGIMFEDINHSGDGGIHGQLLQNNGFQGINQSLNAWIPVGAATIAQDNSSALTPQIPSTLSVKASKGTNGTVGVANQGYLGIPVNKDTYSTSFWYKGSLTGDLTVSLVGNSTGTVFGSANISVAASNNFTEYNATIQATQSLDGNNTWQVTFEPSATDDISINLGLPQLFPTTYKGRSNGLRNDVATFLADLKPSFLRMPGGNNIEGDSPANRWQWNLTIGPVQNRPGREGDWGYPNTDALGLMEYLQWCEDMSMAPILAVWSGLTLNNGGVTTGDALQPYVQDTLNELEFVLGDASSTYGKLRAEYGHSDPYNVTMIEIGNEDNLNGGCSTYPERFQAYYDAVSKAYPSLQIIASTTNSTCLPSPVPSNVWTDIHHYEVPDDFITNFDEFDNYPRTNGSGIFVGEYAAYNTTTDVPFFQYMQASVSEAVYMIGLERNSDLVKMASYAPLIEHFGLEQWSPDLFGFDSSPGSITGSTSYYVQQLFGAYRSATILPVASDTSFNPVFWVAGQSADAKTYYVKLANYAANATDITVKIPNAQGLAANATLNIVSGSQLQTNVPHNVTVTIQTSSVTGNATGGYTLNMPAWGVGVLAIGS